MTPDVHSPTDTAGRDLFIIAPAYNESLSLDAFVREITSSLADPVFGDYRATLVIVDDGSTDSTMLILRELADQYRSARFRLVGIELSRNFGHQNAIHAGLAIAFARARKDAYFILMDADLEHPPQYIATIVRSLASGNDHVQMVRNDEGHTGNAAGKTVVSRLYYRIFQHISGLTMPPGSADYRGMNYQVLKAFLEMPEVDRFNRGLFWWVGFSRVEIPYRVGARVAGRSKYSWRDMFRLGLTGIVAFSSRPLLITLGATVAVSFAFCGLYLTMEAYRIFFLHRPFVVGWPSIIFLVSLWGGVLSLGQLLLAVYVAKVFTEVKGRPTFIVKAVHG